MRLNLTFTMSPELKATLERLNRTPKLFGAAMYTEAAPLMDAAVARAPRDVGGLVASAYVRPPTNKDAPSIELGFGAPWSAYIHERVDLHHANGEAKFLERAIDAGARGFFDRCGQRIAGWIEKGKEIEASSRYPPTAPGGGREHSSRSLKRASLRRRRR